MGTQETNARPAKPVSSHPLFPLVVAVWFAALFGLGSLAIRPALLEAVVLATQLDTLVPAAAPPLGFTARILLALALAGLGCVLGLVLGRRIARVGAERRERLQVAAEMTVEGEALEIGRGDAQAEAPARRPLLAREDLDEDGFDAPAEPEADPATPGMPPRRRRALAVTDETRRSEFLDFAPLPGGHGSAVPEMAEDAVLELAELADQAVEAADAAARAGEPRVADLELDWSQALPVTADRPFDSPPELLRNAFADADHADGNDPTPASAMPEPETDAVAIACADADEQAGIAVNPIDDETETPAPAQAPRSATANPEAQDLGALGMVELAERLARAMERRREARPDPVATTQPAMPVPLPVTLQPVPAVAEEPLAEAGEAPVAVEPDPATPEPLALEPQTPEPLPIPAAFRAFAPKGIDEGDEEFELPSLLSSTTFVQAPSPAEPERSALQPEIDDEDASEDAGEAEDAAAADEGPFSSLLEMSRQAAARQQFVRIEDEPESAAVEPVVIFPGQSAGPRLFDPPGTVAAPAGLAGPAPAAAMPGPARDAEETERALRAALASLQRMSGAA